MWNTDSEIYAIWAAAGDTATGGRAEYWIEYHC